MNTNYCVFQVFSRKINIQQTLIPFSKLRINQKKKIFFCSVVLVLQVFSRPALQCQLVEAEVVEVLEIPLNDSFESFASSCDLTSCGVASVVKFQEQGSTGSRFLLKIQS